MRFEIGRSGHVFDDKTGTSFSHSKLKLEEWHFTICVFLRFNTSLRRIEAKFDIPTGRRDGASTLEVPSITLPRPVEIDETYVSADLKGCEPTSLQS